MAKVKPPPIKIINAKDVDAKDIEKIVNDLLDYHKLSGKSVLNENLLASKIGSFSDASKYFESFLAIVDIYNPDTDAIEPKVVGHLMYQKYFSFLAGKIIWMENFFVDKKFRGQQVGQKLLKMLAKMASDEDAVIQWLCADWNVDSIGFYEHVGAKEQFRRSDGWICYEFDRDAIKTLASKEF